MAALGNPSSSSQILLPARASTIIGSFAIALFLNFLPWPDLRLAPDFVALVLTFWCLRQPRLVGIGTGWLLGLLCDAGNGVLLGQHALSYSLLAFAAAALSRRILWFGTMQQALHVGALLIFAQLVSALVRGVAGAELAGWTLLVGPVIGAILWPAASWLLLAPQRRSLDPQHSL